MVQRRYESQISSGCGKVDVGARLVRLRLEREPIAVALVHRIPTEIIDCIAKPLDCLVGPPASIRLDAFSSAPHHEDLRPELSTDIHRLHSLLKSVSSDARIVRGEGAVAKDRIVEEIDRGHRHPEPRFLASSLELAYDAIALGRRRVDWHEIVVVKIHAHGAYFGQQADQLDWRHRGPDGLSERVAPAIADRPQAEREFMLGARCVRIVWHFHYLRVRAEKPVALLHRSGLLYST